MQSDDGLACSCRAGNPRGTAVISLHPLALRRMEKHCPLFPWIIEGALKLLEVLHHSESVLGIGVGKRIGFRGGRLGHFRFSTGGEFEERLRGLNRQTIRQCQQGVFGGISHVVQPFGRHAVDLRVRDREVP